MPYTNKSEQVIKKKNERDTLKRHLNMNRVKVSQTVKEMVQYCQAHQEGDPLIIPVRENPFKEKRPCNIL